MIKLANGKKIKEGDKIQFIDSDGKKQICEVKRRKFDCKHALTDKIFKKGTLFFCNSSFEPLDYGNADILNCKII